MHRSDVLIVGGGHNGLCAATFLARAGRSVHVLERASVLGGAVRTEYPFPRAPEVAASTGSYLLGLMPPELVQKLGIQVPLMRRDPHYFLPTQGDRYLLFGSDAAEMKRQFLSFFSEQDFRAYQALQAELEMLREDTAPTWLTEPLSIEETAERYIRPTLRDTFIKLCRGSVGDYLERFDFKSDLVKAMYAVTDGFSGLAGTWDTPGTGMNFLVHNMCRLPGADGTWMVVRGGMGTVTRLLHEQARAAGATFETDAEVGSIDIESGVAKGVTLIDGRVFRAEQIIVNADPFRMSALCGDQMPAAFEEKIAGYERKGTTFKVNMALSALPTFTCLPEDRGQHRGTIHLLPEESRVLASLHESFEDIQAGRLAEFPTIEWYIHTTMDPALGGPQGRHSAALFVQWVPYEIAGSSWEKEESRYIEHLLSICDRFAPGTSDLVIDTFPLHPQKIESHFGITHGHIHHIDNGYGFADRLPYRSPIAGLYSCSAGTHPAGSVIGAAGHNAAMAVLDS